MDAHEALVEKVAEEIRARRDGAGCTPWSRLNDAHKVPYRRDARVALSVVAETLREPTPEMEKAWGDCDHPETAAGDWHVMLSASPLYPKKDATDA